MEKPITNFKLLINATRDVCETRMPSSLGNIHEENQRKLQITRIFKVKWAYM